MTHDKTVNLTDLAHNKKLKDLLEFPCDFTFKVVGAARADLIDDVVQTAHKTIKGDYTPTMKESGKGTYHSFQSRCVQTILNRLKRFIKHWQKLKAFAWCYSKIGGIKFIISPIFIFVFLNDHAFFRYGKGIIFYVFLKSGVKF